MAWIWLSGGTVAVICLVLMRSVRSSGERRHWPLACSVIAGGSGIVCSMGAAATARSPASFALGIVLGFAVIWLLQDRLWRRYG